MDFKKLFHVLVVGGAVIGTGGACSKPKASSGNADIPGAAPSPAATATTPKPDSDTNGTPQGQPPSPSDKDKGGGTDGW